MSSLQEMITTHAARVEQLLDHLLQIDGGSQQPFRPARLVEAMRHSTLNGGKRIRPCLLMESAAMLGVAPDTSVMAATALECIHCYSLVHDDLPAMDNDDLRRGQPTTHKAFDEATAILAGDSLLTLAFEILADQKTHPDPGIRSELVALYSAAAGFSGMAGGQMLDLEAEARPVEESEILRLQAMKTGALIRCACEAAAVLADAETATRKRLGAFGTKIGQAFQLVDDLLDVTATTLEMGKQTAKDAKRGKGTIVAIHGLENCRMMADRLLEEALEEIAPFGAEAGNLGRLARFVVERKN